MADVPYRQKQRQLLHVGNNSSADVDLVKHRFKQFIRLARLPKETSPERKACSLSAGHHDDLQARIRLCRKLSKLNARHLTGEMDVGHNNSELRPRGGQDKLSSFGGRTFNDFKAPTFQKIGQKHPLECIVLDDEGHKI